VEPNPLSAELASLQRDNAHLARCLARAEAIIAVQKKLADLLGIPMTPDGGVP
jgi:transposase